MIHIVGAGPGAVDLITVRAVSYTHLASLPAAKEVGGGIEDGRLLAGMCVRTIGGYKAG